MAAGTGQRIAVAPLGRVFLLMPGQVGLGHRKNLTQFFGAALVQPDRPLAKFLHQVHAVRHHH